VKGGIMDQENLTLNDTAKKLGISSPTLRRWWDLLKQNGYVSEVELQGKRIMFDMRDLEALQGMQCLYKCMTVEAACVWVVRRYMDSSSEKSNSKQVCLQNDVFKLLDDKLSNLSASLYWQGQDVVINEIQSIWKEVKNNLIGVNEG
jgi:hypothetical protein